MRVYLKKNYREVVAGDPSYIYPVFIDAVVPELPRFYIEAGQKQMQILKQLNMLEEEIPVMPEAAALENDEIPAPELSKDVSDSYYCKRHQKNHKKGSASYVACYDANFGQDAEEKQ